MVRAPREGEVLAWRAPSGPPTSPPPQGAPGDSLPHLPSGTLGPRRGCPCTIAAMGAERVAHTRGWGRGPQKTV